MVMSSEIINIKEYAALFGVSEKTIRRNLDDIPHKRIGRQIFFRRATAFEGFASKNVRPTAKRPRVRINPAAVGL